MKVVLASIVSFAKDEWNIAANKAIASFAWSAKEHGIRVLALNAPYYGSLPRWYRVVDAVNIAQKFADDGFVGIINPCVVATEDGILKLVETIVSNGDAAFFASMDDFKSKFEHFERCCVRCNVWNKGLKFWALWHLVFWRSKYTKDLLMLINNNLSRLSNFSYHPLEDAINVALHHYFFFTDKSEHPKFVDLEFARFSDEAAYPISFMSIEKIAEIYGKNKQVVGGLK